MVALPSQPPTAQPAAADPATRPTAHPAPTWSAAASTSEYSGTELMTGEAVGLDVRPAGFILRAAGAIIDWLTSIGLFLAFLFLIGAMTGSSADPALATALIIASLVIAIVIMPMSVEALSRGRSLGRLAIGARIVRDDGGAAQLRHAFIRALTGVLEIYMTFGGLAALVGLLSPRSKRLGDLLAGTYSQHERVPRILEPVFGVPPTLATWAMTADVARLPDRLSRRIAGFIRQAADMTPAARAGIAVELAREAGPFVSPVPHVHPETFLAGVAAVRRDRDYRALLLERERLQRVQAALTGLPHSFPER